MALDNPPKTERDRLAARERGIKARLNNGNLDPNERSRAQAALNRVRAQLAGEFLLPGERGFHDQGASSLQ